MVAPAVEFSSQLPNDCESHKMIAAWINREREDASNHRLKQAQHSDGLYFSIPPIIYLCVGGDGGDGRFGQEVGRHTGIFSDLR